MNYEGLTCQHCGNIMHDSEDIVVCPVCATPQHRECWMEKGCCANEELHAEGFVWSGKENIQPAPETPSATDTVICHICGSENPADSLHCGNCGALFGEKSETTSSAKTCGFCGKENDSDAIHCKYCGAPITVGSPYYNDNPYLAGTGIGPDELIGGMKASDIALYTQSGSKRYLPKFKRFAKGKKLSFNFAAFFLAPYWFFFRKLYKAGIFFTVLFATASLMLSGFATEVFTAFDAYASVVDELNIESATEEELIAFETVLEKANAEMVEKAKKPALIILGVDLAAHILCALLADRLYYRKLKEDMKLIEEGVKEPHMRKLMLTRRGGLSPLAFAISIMGYNSLVQLLVSGADMIMNNF